MYIAGTFSKPQSMEATQCARRRPGRAEVQSEPYDKVVFFENLGNSRLAEVAKNRKLNGWMLTHMNRQNAVACGHCTSLAEGPSGVELASRAEGHCCRDRGVWSQGIW